MEYDSLEKTAHTTGMTDLEYDERQEVMAEVARSEDLYAKMKSQALYANILKMTQRHSKQQGSSVRAARLRSAIGSAVNELERRFPTPKEEWTLMYEDLK